MSPEQLYIINFVMLVLGVVGFIAIIIRLLYRFYEYHKARWKRPRLLFRDLVLFMGLTIPFLAIIIRRLLRIDGVVDQLWWNLITTLPAIIAIYYWLWEELFVVGSEDGEEGVCPCCGKPFDNP